MVLALLPTWSVASACPFPIAKRFAKQFEPAREMALFEAIDRDMLAHRAAGEFAAVVQHRTPEALHLLEMGGPVGDVLGKDRAEQFIVANAGVKAVDEGRDVSRVDAHRQGFVELGLTGVQGKSALGCRQSSGDPINRYIEYLL